MKLSRRLRFFILIFLAESLLYFSLFAPELDQIKEVRGIQGTPTPRLRAAPLPIIQAPPEEKFMTIEEHFLKNPSELRKWDEKIFRGKTVYTVAGEEGDAYLRATSNQSSSGLYLKDLRYAPAGDLFLEWEWRAVKFPKKQKTDKLSNRSEDDFAARIYVIFPGTSFFNTNVMEYIWDENLPQGTIESSPFSSRVKLFVIRSGVPDPAENGGWRVERRNIFEDYRKVYGEDQRRSLGAIGLMSDSDNTKTATEAHFRSMAFKRKIRPGDLKKKK